VEEFILWLNELLNRWSSLPTCEECGEPFARNSNCQTCVKAWFDDQI